MKFYEITMFKYINGPVDSYYLFGLIKSVVVSFNDGLLWQTMLIE